MSEHEHDPGREAVPPAVPALRSIGALTDVRKVLGNVDTSSVTRSSGLPLLIYKARENVYTIGTRRLVPEPGVRWLVDIGTFARGYVAFVNNKPTERMAPSQKDEVDFLTLPDVGAQWSRQWAVHLVCLDGVDAGVEVLFKVNTNGGEQAIAGLYAEVHARADAGVPEVIPLVTLGSDWYPHPTYGKTWKPLLEVAAWMPVSGPIPPATVAKPEPAPSQPPQPAAAAADEQPRRRRRVA